MDEKYLYAKIAVLVPANTGSDAADQIQDLFAGTDINWDYVHNNSFAYNPTEVYAIHDGDALVASHVRKDDGSVTLSWQKQYTISLYILPDRRQLKQFTGITRDEVEAKVIMYAMHQGWTLLFPREAVRDD